MVQPSAACSACKKSHVKCDKLLPSCTSCSNRLIKCCYQIDAAQTDNQPTSLEVLKDEIRKESIRFSDHYLEISYELQCISPFFTIEEYRDTIKYLDSEHYFGLFDPPSNIPRWEYQSIICTCYAIILARKGQLAKTQILMQRARLIALNNDFEKVSSDFMTAICFLFLGSLSAQLSDHPRSGFFISNVQNYITNQENNSNTHPCHNFLLASSVHFLKRLVDFKPSENLMNAIELIYNKTHNISLFYRTEYGKRIAHNKQVAESFASVKHPYSFAEIRAAMTDYAKGDCILTEVMQIYVDHAKDLCRITNHNFFELRLLNIELLFMGVRLQFYVSMGDDDKALSMADSIVTLISKVDVGSCYFYVTEAITVAANLHMRYIKQCTNTNQLDYCLNCLKTERDSLEKFVHPLKDGIKKVIFELDQCIQKFMRVHKA
ncbi:hypothetical protein AKO1_007733 [Acrasis kona]|uniref:Zn(2)-C6 fungal-type domain-containing protein n=1 Tax=Acrasis kona TaxID=1008807 RepID=A0AAW2YRW3_9EUKA